MSTDFRALCAELADVLAELPFGTCEELLVRARAALTADGPAVPEGREPASVVGEPSDEEIIQEAIKADLVYRPIDDEPYVFSGFVESHSLNTYVLSFARAVLSRWSHQPVPPVEGEGLPSDQEIADVFSQGCRDLSRSYEPPFLGGARAILARWGRPAPVPTPPAEGEVAELVARLRYAKHNGGFIPSGVHWGLPDGTTHHGSIYVGDDHASDCARAADLLAQRHPEPVPVAERLPCLEDCDAEGRCWLLTVEDEYPQWRLHSIEGGQPGGETMIWVPVDSSPGVMVDCFYTSHWLPVHALPLPAGEVE